MWDWISKIQRLRESYRPFAIVTVIGSHGSTPRAIGAKMVVLEDGNFFGTVGGGHLEQLTIEEARKCLTLHQSKTEIFPLGARTGQCCGGSMTLLFEILNVGPELYLFGAGHIGRAVCEVLVQTPFRIHLIDNREEWIESEKIPRDVIRHFCEWDEFTNGAMWDSNRTYAVVLTHDHGLDQKIIAHLIKRNARYIGLIGSRAKWKRFTARLKARGYSEEELRRVTCPIGLPVGGKAPKEVAISLASELLSIHYERRISTSASGRREIESNGVTEGTFSLREETMDSPSN